MFVPCPHCGFLVALIVSRAGQPQRCPRCHKPLQVADGDMRDHGDTDGDAAAATSPAGLAAAAGRPADATPATPDMDTGGDAGTDASATTPAPVRSAVSQSAVSQSAANQSTAKQSAGKPGHRRHRPAGAPSFARRSVSMIELGPRWPGLLAVVVLLALLALQLLLAQRHQLAADARWRPTVTIACGLLGCELPPWREPAAFTMLDRKVRPAPARPDVLLVAASFRNDAQWPQPWPRLLLRLSDSNGRTVAQGLFTAAQYRQVAAPAVLAPGQSASVRFAVREPATSTVAFQFEFL